MENFLLQLAQMSRDIEGDGWLMIPRPHMPGQLALRVEWYQFEEKLGYQEIYTLHQIEHGNINLSTMFVENANRAFREAVENL